MNNVPNRGDDPPTNISITADLAGPNRLPQYFTTTEVAERYRTAESSVRYWSMINYGPKSVKVGRRRLYPVAEIEKFDAELARQAGGAA